MPANGVMRFVAEHELAFGYVASAAIATMPAADCPLTWKTLYVWFYDAVHMALNMRRPTPPVPPPAQPKP